MSLDINEYVYVLKHVRQNVFSCDSTPSALIRTDTASKTHCAPNYKAPIILIIRYLAPLNCDAGLEISASTDRHFTTFRA
jgi:hypothetical protein